MSNETGNARMKRTGNREKKKIQKELTNVIYLEVQKYFFISLKFKNRVK